MRLSLNPWTLRPPPKPMDDSRRCTGISSRSGKRCKKAAIKGGTVCATHGGAAPQVRAAAERREVERQTLAEAQRMVAKDESNKHPIEHLVDSMALASMQVMVWGDIVADLDDPDKPGELLTYSKAHGAQLHPFVSERDAWVDRKAKYADMCLKANVAEREIQLTEQQAASARRAFEAAMSAIHLSNAEKQEARRAYADDLRRQ